MVFREAAFVAIACCTSISSQFMGLVLAHVCLALLQSKSAMPNCAANSGEKLPEALHGLCANGRAREYWAWDGRLAQSRGQCTVVDR